METILAYVTKVVRRRRILQNQHLAVKKRIKIAKDRNKDIDPEVHKWLEDATNLLEKEQNFLEPYRGRTLRSYNYQEAEDIADEIDMLVRKGKFDIISDLQSEIVDRQPKMLEGLESRMSIFREIMEALRDNDVGLIGVLGTAGVGKTTIVVEAGRYAAEEEGFFDVTVFSVVSNAPHAISKIQYDIAKDLDIPLDPEERESERARKIYGKLTSGERKVLIILDDVWEWLDLKSIGIPTESGRRPVLCKVLLTSRTRIEWSTCYKTKTISVGTLPNEEALLLFNKIVGEIDSARYLDLGRRIVESFDGVPLVIAAVANLLVGRSLSEWTRAVKTLSIDKIFSFGPSRSIEDLRFYDHGIFSSFKRSYDHLRNEEDKFIFLLSSIFGGQIDKEDLLKYALGLGLFQGADTARDKIYHITSSLKQSSLLEDGKTSRYVTMNETIRNLAFALAVASRADGDCFIVGKNSWELLRTDDVAKFGHIFLQISDDTQELPQGLSFPNLKLLRIYDESRSSKNIPDEFFRGTEGGLRVLALINMELRSLPPSLRVLENLDTLCLDCCVLEDISMIGELRSLRVLSLSHTSIVQLPQQIGQLTRLCLLDLSSCSKLDVIPPNVLSNLTQLEDLRMENSFTNWVAGGGSDKSNASLVELTSLKHLTALNIHIPDAKMIPNATTWDHLLRYNIKIGDDFPCASEWDVSKVLKLNNSKGSIDVSEPWIKSLWKSCEGLCMKEFKGLKNLNVELSGKLAYLHIEDHDELEFAFNLSLLELEIARCQTTGKYNLAAAIPGSKHLKLIGLPEIENLVELATIDQAVPMANWETMEIKDCDGLRCLFIIKDVDADKTYGGQGLLFELRQLCLRNLNSFTSIIDDEHPRRILNFKLLNQLTVSGCNQLKYLLPLNVLNTNLEHLQNLDISDCANLEQVFVIDEGAVAIMSNTMVIPVLRSLKLSKLPKLASICHETCRIICRCLKKMTIEDCPNLAFSFAHTEEKYRSMYYNREMITVPSVKNLNLRQLNHLKKMCKDRLVNFKHLTSLQLDQCNHLEYLFPLSVAQGLSSLQELQIISCQRVEQIVIKEKEGKQIVIEEKEGEQIVIKEKEETDSKKAIVKFPQVQTLILKNLPKFTRFCQDGCSVEWPSLKTVEVVECPKILKLKSLGKTNKHLLENQWEENDLESNINHLFDSINELEVTIEGSEQLKEYIKKMEDRQSLFSQLKKLKAIECDEELNKFLCTLHRRSHGLEELSVENCQLLEQVFDLGEFAEKKKYQPPTQTGGSDEKKQFDGTERSYNPGKRNSKHQPPTQTGEILEEEEHYGPKIRFFNRVTRDTHHQPPTKIITKLDLGESDEEKQSNRTTGCLNIGRRNSQRQPPTQTRPKVDLGESDKEKQSNRTTRRSKKGRRKSQHQPRTKTRRNVDPGESDAREEGNGLFPNLHTIRLSDLPKLNCIWNEDPNGIVELGQLAKLEIIKCGLRKSLLLSTASVKKLENLEELNIDSCEMIEEVVGEDMKMQERSFPKLKNLQLVNLPSLIKFNFGLPKLLSLRIEDCPKMDAFTTGFLSTEGPTIEGTSNHMVDENMDVCPELQELKLVGLDPFKEIWLGCVSTKSVCELKKLEVDTLCNLKYIFRSSMLPKLEKLEKLVVRNCKLLRNIVFPLSAEKDMELKLPMLKELVFSCLPTLENVFEIDSMMTFENLEILQIKSCVSLQKLLLFSSCLKLSKLEISDCDTLEEIFIDRGEKTKSLPNLESIVLENLPRLSSLFQETFEFPLLKEVRIVNCPALPTFSRNVSPTADRFFSDMDSIENLEEPAQDSSSNTLKRLQKLKKITVQRCDPLLVLFGINEGSPSGATELLPLKQEPKIPVFRKLTSLEIMRCGSIKIVFSISVAEHLTELKLLKLYDCENVEQVLQGGRKNSKVVFQNLKFLILKHLPKLTSFCEGEFDFKFPELKEVRVWNIPAMNTFVKKSPETPNLKEVYVTYIKKCWQGDLNQTITYLAQKARPN